MFFVTGDTHADWTRLSTLAFPEQKEMTKDDYVLILGDFGIWDSSARENYWLDWLNDKKFTTLFISGNHSNYDILDFWQSEEWKGGSVNKIRDSVIHLKRGQIFRIDGYRFFTFGGASSHDIKDGILDPQDKDFKEKKYILDRTPGAMYRVKHQSWWDRELPSEDEMQTGRMQLEKVGNQVDYVFTHCAPTSIQRQMNLSDTTYVEDYLTDYLDEIECKIEYEKWMFGHYHFTKEITAKHQVVYKDIIRLF